MIVKVYHRTRADGVKLYKSYSDTGKRLRQNETGNVYEEAIDVEDAPYTYSEIPAEEAGDEATEADYLEALAELGVTDEES